MRYLYGAVCRIAIVTEDVRERVCAQKELQLFSDIAHNMQVGLYVYHLEDRQDDRTLRLMVANPASSTGLGLREEEIIGQYIDQIFPRLRERGIPRQFADVVRTGQPFDWADFDYSDDGLRPACFSFEAFPLPGDCVGILFEDVTERKRMEEARKHWLRLKKPPWKPNGRLRPPTEPRAPSWPI